jgi:hypothetical protein
MSIAMEIVTQRIPRPKAAKPAMHPMAAEPSTLFWLGLSLLNVTIYSVGLIEVSAHAENENLLV